MSCVLVHQSRGARVVGVTVLDERETLVAHADGVVQYAVNSVSKVCINVLSLAG
jgi:ribosomal protein L27